MTAIADTRITLTLDEAAAATGLSPMTLRRYVRDGLIARVPGIHRLLIRVEELERFTREGAA